MKRIPNHTRASSVAGPLLALCFALATASVSAGEEGWLTHFESAQKQAVTEKKDKAVALIEGLQMLSEDFVDWNYRDVIEKIGQLDPEDKSGFVKVRTAAMAKKEAEHRAEVAIELLDKGDLAAAHTFIDQFAKENPEGEVAKNIDQVKAGIGGQTKEIKDGKQPESFPE